jgi:hypothetical protein
VYFIILFIFFFYEGICEIPQCDLRQPLQNHLCRIDANDECFLYNSQTSEDPICVPECPPGSEEEHDTSGYSTGTYLLNVIIRC